MHREIWNPSADHRPRKRHSLREMRLVGRENNDIYIRRANKFPVDEGIISILDVEKSSYYYAVGRYLIIIIIHSKYFPDSDLLKAHA